MFKQHISRIHHPIPYSIEHIPYHHFCICCHGDPSVCCLLSITLIKTWALQLSRCSVDTTVTHAEEAPCICFTVAVHVFDTRTPNAHEVTESFIDKRLTGLRTRIRTRNHHNYSTTGAYWPPRAITWHLLTVFDIWLVNMVHLLHYVTQRWQINN